MVLLVLRSVLWQLLVEEAEEASVVVVEVVYQVVGVAGARGVGDQASPGVPSGSVPKESRSSEHQQGRVVHEIEHCQQPLEQHKHHGQET